MKTKIKIAFLALALSGFWAAVANAAPVSPKDAHKVHVATCRDGKEMYAATDEHRGACSGHGGVAVWADGSPVKSNGKESDYR